MPALIPKSRQRMPIETFSLRSAIEQNRLALFYQPRISAKTLKLVGAEALLRWQVDEGRWASVPDLHMLSASEFAELWSWKLEQIKGAFEQIRGQCGYQVCGAPFVLSLNLSYKQLHSYEWATQLLAMLAASDAPNECFEVELTEQHGFRDLVIEESSFEMAREAGVALTLDDFPEGGQSFLRLAQFKFDKVKIDRSLVPSASDSARVWLMKKELLRGLLEIISKAGASSVIEGIENEMHYKFLSELPVHEWQGYYWGRAMPLAELLPALLGSEMVLTTGLLERLDSSSTASR